MTTKGENHCIAMHFIIYTRAYRYRLLVMIITEHPAYPYLATDVARCRDGDVSRVSLNYDAAECSPGLVSMEWYPSLFLDAAKCSPRLVTPSCSWSFSTSVYRVYRGFMVTLCRVEKCIRTACPQRSACTASKGMRPKHGEYDWSLTTRRTELTTDTMHNAMPSFSLRK